MKTAYSYTPHKHSLSLILMLFVLFTGAVIGITVMTNSQDIRSRASATGTTLALTPATKTAKIGETISVGATVNTGSDTISAIELHLSYDPTAIQILSFTPGTLLPVVLTPESHAKGIISVTLGVKPTSPWKGAGIVGTWSIKILAAKQSSLNFANSTQVAAIGKTTNTLASSTGSTITGTTEATVLTPTRIPTSTGTAIAPTNTPISLRISTPTSKPTAKPAVKLATPTIKTQQNTQEPTPVVQTRFGDIVASTPLKPTTMTIPTRDPIQPTQQTAPLSESSEYQSDPQLTDSMEVNTPRDADTTILDQILTNIFSFFQNLFQSREE